MTLVLYAIVLLLVAIGCATLRLSEWSSSESDYWYDIDFKVRMRPELDAEYRPLLTWTRAHRPGTLGRLRGWRPPDVRQRQAVIAEAARIQRETGVNPLAMGLRWR